MALQMVGAEPVVLPMTKSYAPSLEALREAFSSSSSGGKRIRAVTVVNPGNPTGTMIPLPLLEAIRDLCEAQGAFLVVDNTYEYFDYDGQHRCVEGDHVVNLFSFSKAYGAMGWRVGYLAYPSYLRPDLEKIQDTIIITPTAVSQAFALACLRDAGKPWVLERLESLREPRRIIRDALDAALSPLTTTTEEKKEEGGNVVSPGTGAIYFLASLPEALADDDLLAKRLVDDFDVALIPGASCGAPGTIRVCYSNLPLDPCREAADRLFKGLTALANDGAARLPPPSSRTNTTTGAP